MAFFSKLTCMFGMKCIKNNTQKGELTYWTLLKLPAWQVSVQKSFFYKCCIHE